MNATVVGVIVMATAASCLLGCSALPSPETGISGEGEHWVKLSTEENLLADLVTTAQSAGCKVETHTPGDGPTYGAFAVDCRHELLLVSQERDVLRYRCGSLEGKECDALMESLAPRSARGCF